MRIAYPKYPMEDKLILIHIHMGHFWASPRKRNADTKLHEEIINSSSDIFRSTVLRYLSVLFLFYDQRSDV